jgi:hypothetical protein
MNVTISFDTAPCNPYVNRRFEVTYNLHLQRRKSDEQETSVKQMPSHNPLIWLIFDSEDGSDTFFRNFDAQTTRSYIPEDGSILN